VLCCLSSSRPGSFAQAVGDREHKLPVGGRPVQEAVRHGRANHPKGLAIVRCPTGKLTPKSPEPGIVNVVEVGNGFRLNAALERYEDRARQAGVGGILALERDRFGAECRELSRLTPRRDASPPGPPAP